MSSSSHKFCELGNSLNHNLACSFCLEQARFGGKCERVTHGSWIPMTPTPDSHHPGVPVCSLNSVPTHRLSPYNPRSRFTSRAFFPHEEGLQPLRRCTTRIFHGLAESYFECVLTASKCKNPISSSQLRVNRMPTSERLAMEWKGGENYLM